MDEIGQPAVFRRFSGWVESRARPEKFICKKAGNGTLNASGGTCTIDFRGYFVAGDGGIGTVTLSGDAPHGLLNKITLRNHALFIRS
jgi:hypothetical protein